MTLVHTRTRAAAVLAGALSAVTIATAAPAAAQGMGPAQNTGSPSMGSLSADALGAGLAAAGSAGSMQPEGAAPAAGSLATVLPAPAGITRGPSATIAPQDGDVQMTPASASTQTNGAPAHVHEYADDTAAPAPGTFDPDALGQLPPEVLGVAGTLGSLTVGSAALSLGPQGSQTGSVALGSALPGVTYVPATSSVGSGDFVLGGALTIPASTVVRTLLGGATAVIGGYLESMAAKQEAAELTDADIALWTQILDDIDAMRAVFSLPPLERSDPHKQVPVLEQCRRNYPDKARVDKEEAQAHCAEATEADKAGLVWVAPGETREPTAEERVAIEARAAERAAQAGGADAAGATGAPTQAVPVSGRGDTASGGANGAGRRVGAGTDTAGVGQAAASTPERLAYTGVDVILMGLATLVLAAAGGGLILASRRRAEGSPTATPST